MSWLKQHWKMLAGILAGGIVLYLLYQWYQANQAANQSSSTTPADQAAQDAEMQAIQNALQAQGLGSAASGSIVTPSFSSPQASTPSSPATVPDNSGQVMSTVQGSLAGGGGSSVAPINVPAPSDPTGGYNGTGYGGGGYQPTTVPNTTASGYDPSQTASAPTYTPNTYSTGGSSASSGAAAAPAAAAISPVRGTTRGTGGLPTSALFGAGTRSGSTAAAAPAPTRGGLPNVTSSTIFGGTRGTLATPVTSQVAPTRGATRAVSTGTPTIQRSSLPTSSRRA